ncbi:hypothetical protein [Hyphomicrobium sp. MC8b]|uniref:hypothetical protein n=1 Tax=Hyphomicrobium sp. MC8b TaxID=300273 RepID=UPI00391C69BA
MTASIITLGGDGMGGVRPVKVSNVKIHIGGRLMYGKGPSDMLDALDFPAEPGSLEFSARVEPTIPPHIEKLRSVSPAAKRIFARNYWWRRMQTVFADEIAQRLRNGDPRGVTMPATRNR